MTIVALHNIVRACRRVLLHNIFDWQPQTDWPGAVSFDDEV